jgi:Zn-dependent peptidase ImmA (M78 family)
MKWIDEIVMGTKDRYGTCNPFDLCDYLDIQLIKTDRNAFILRKQSSVYVRSFMDKETIFYAKGLRYQRLKFYLLHEIGHALLHTDMRFSPLTNDLRIEREANYFAVKMILCESPCEGQTAEKLALINDIPQEILKSVV